MAAASNAAPVQSPLGANAADDAILVGSHSLFATAQIFRALDDPRQWSLSGFQIPDESDADEQYPDAFIAAPPGSTTDHKLDLLPMLLSALEEERVDSAATSLGVPSQFSPRTLIAGHA